VYCDFWDIACIWLKSGAAISLDSCIENMCVIDSAVELLDIKALKRMPLLSIQQQLDAILIKTRNHLHEEAATFHIDASNIRSLQSNLRSAEGDLERITGKLQAVTENLTNMRERLALREKIREIVTIKKRLKKWANMLSDLNTIDWDDGYSTTTISVIPKKGAAFSPFVSTLFEAQVVRPTTFSISIFKQKMNISIDGVFKCSFLGISSIPSMNVHTIIIDSHEGLRLEGDAAIVVIRQKEGVPIVAISTSE